MEQIVLLGILFIPIVLISFLATILIVPQWVKISKRMKLLWEDMHKIGHPKNVAGSGGVGVIFGFLFGVFLYLAIKTFVFNSQTNLIEIIILVSTMILASFIGFIDDMIGWKTGGLSNGSRIFMIAMIAVPLMAFNAGTSTILGINIGIFYPLILIPIAIIGTTSTFNFLAGYNGLETSQGILVLGALSVVTFITGTLWLSVVTACMVAALVAFYFFNKYPAKVFPGDTLTYPVGALIGAIAILGNVEKIAVFFFIPYIIEFFLKARGKLKKQSFAKLNKDHSIEVKEGIYGLEHVAIRILQKIKPSGKAYEWEVPMLINLFQIIVIVVGFIWFF